MRPSELFRSCSNEHVAIAALACIGGVLERRVDGAARSAGLSRGAFLTRILADYDRKASPKRRKSLEKGMRSHQTPILAGLRHVVETALDDAWAEEVEADSHGAGQDFDDLRALWSGAAAMLRDGSVHTILHA